MKLIKSIVLFSLVALLIFMIFIFVVSFSFKNIYYNEKDDSTIVLIKGSNESTYKYSKKNQNITGTITVETNIIVLVSEDNTRATAIYSSKDNSLTINGKIGKNKYKNEKYKQIRTIKEYFKSLF